LSGEFFSSCRVHSSDLFSFLTHRAKNIVGRRERASILLPESLSDGHVLAKETCEKCQMPLVCSLTDNQISCVVCPALLREVLAKKINNLDEIFARVEMNKLARGKFEFAYSNPWKYANVNNTSNSHVKSLSQTLPLSDHSDISYSSNLASLPHQTTRQPQDDDCESIVSRLDDIPDEKSLVASSTLETILSRIEELTSELATDIEVTKKVEIVKLIEGLAKAASALSSLNL